MKWDGPNSNVSFNVGVLESSSDLEWVSDTRGDILKTISFLPRKCRYSGESLWLKNAVCLRCQCFKNYQFEWVERWYSVESFTILQLMV